MYQISVWIWQVLNVAILVVMKVLINKVTQRHAG